MHPSIILLPLLAVLIPPTLGIRNDLAIGYTKCQKRCSQVVRGCYSRTATGYIFGSVATINTSVAVLACTSDQEACFVECAREMCRLVPKVEA